MHFDFFPSERIYRTRLIFKYIFLTLSGLKKSKIILIIFNGNLDTGKNLLPEENRQFKDRTNDAAIEVRRCVT